MLGPTGTNGWRKPRCFSLQYVIFCCIIPNYQVLDVNNRYRLRRRILNVGAR